MHALLEIFKTGNRGEKMKARRLIESQWVDHAISPTSNS